MKTLKAIYWTVSIIVAIIAAVLDTYMVYCYKKFTKAHTYH